MPNPWRLQHFRTRFGDGRRNFFQTINHGAGGRLGSSVSLPIEEDFPPWSPLRHAQMSYSSLDDRWFRSKQPAFRSQPAFAAGETSRIERLNFGWNKSAIGRLYACGKSSAPIFYVALECYFESTSACLP